MASDILQLPAAPTPDPAAQAAALLAVLELVGSTLSNTIAVLNQAAGSGDMTAVWACVDSLTIAGVMVDTALDACPGHAPINGASVFDWNVGEATREKFAQAGWRVQR